MAATDDFRLVFLGLTIAVTVSYIGIAQERARHLWLEGTIAKAIVEEKLQAWSPSWVKETFILYNFV